MSDKFMEMLAKNENALDKVPIMLDKSIIFQNKRKLLF